MTSLAMHLQVELDRLKSAGLYKSERIITGRQAGTVELSTGQDVINLCANNYLGLSGNGRACCDRAGSS